MSGALLESPAEHVDNNAEDADGNAPKDDDDTDNDDDLKDGEWYICVGGHALARTRIEGISMWKMGLKFNRRAVRKMDRDSIKGAFEAIRKKIIAAIQGARHIKRNKTVWKLDAGGQPMSGVVTVSIEGHSLRVASNINQTCIEYTRENVQWFLGQLQLHKAGARGGDGAAAAVPEALFNDEEMNAMSANGIRYIKSRRTLVAEHKIHGSAKFYIKKQRTETALHDEKLKKLRQAEQFVESGISGQSKCDE